MNRSAMALSSLVLKTSKDEVSVSVLALCHTEQRGFFVMAHQNFSHCMLLLLYLAKLSAATTKNLSL